MMPFYAHVEMRTTSHKYLCIFELSFVRKGGWQNNCEIFRMVSLSFPPGGCEFECAWGCWVELTVFICETYLGSSLNFSSLAHRILFVANSSTIPFT
jgi:hypothetical protein